MKNPVECKGIHPYPLFFETSQPLIREVKYLLSLHMSFPLEEDVSVATIWGFQGVPRHSGRNQLLSS